VSDQAPDAGARDDRGAQGEGGAQGEHERARALREQLKALHAADLGYEMALSLVSFGSQKLGLTDDTAELRDLDDARLSIELLRALLDVLERQGAGAPAGELRETLAQLQLGYAHAVQLAAPAEAASGGDVPSSEAAAQPGASAEPEPEAEPEPGAEPESGADTELGGSAEGGPQEGGEA
jgi:hypothetical protein